MKTFLFLFIPFLFITTLFGLVGTVDRFEESDLPIWLSIFLFSIVLLIPSYYMYMQTEDDFLFLWVKTKTKRLKERKNSAKEAMRKELEEENQ